MRRVREGVGRIERISYLEDKCFVIMPFGIKPIPDELNQTFDFDKVYRTIIRRAVKEADMEAIRADEQTGSHIIHTDMFRELRDRTVVLADLSLGNPNVYYELGIRHVLAPGGTVLICREGTELPFDIKLSRVIFYRFNGTDIDWEVVEQIVPKLRDALLTAKEQRPDSPVHALLDKVYPEDQCKDELSSPSAIGLGSETELTKNQVYEQIVAKEWIAKKADIKSLINQHNGNVFGTRALGELCMLSDPGGAKIFEIAEHLYFLMQYELSYTILKKLEDQSDSYVFTPDNYIKYGSVNSEYHPTEEGAAEGLSVMEKGLAIVENEKEKSNKFDPYQLFRLYNSIGGLQRWKWQLSNSQDDLKQAIESLNNAIQATREVENSRDKPVGQIAKLHLRLLVLERIAASIVDRSDSEDHSGAILKLNESDTEDPKEASYLRWYKTIVYADAGNEYKVRQWTLNAVQEDKVLKDPEVGGAQYVMIRRFIDNNLPFLKNHTLMGLISQDLQYASRSGKGD